MNSAVPNQYLPNYVSPPGETLNELLEELGMSQAELSIRTGRPKKTINEIIHGKAVITVDTALQFERVLGVPASFWNNREQLYRDFLARQEEEKRLREWSDWVDRFPYREMCKLGWVNYVPDKVERIRIILNFFRISTPEQFEAYWSKLSISYRKSNAFKVNHEATYSWLQRGEIEAQDRYIKSYDSKAFKFILQNIRNLTRLSPTEFIPQVITLCAEVGVTVIFVPPLPGIRASGVTRWLSSKRPIIQMSLRHKSDDHFWFTFFHECKHVLQEKKTTIFVESDEAHDDPLEREADSFAANFLIPYAHYSRFISFGNLQTESIINFSSDLGISPGIVVGRLQHDRYLSWKHCNELKKNIEWVDVPKLL
ncbi:ImmA/IrrE family metallo-endopeptidase [Candidatus Synechococcus calcipolaris G9]|uniref:ImmA/IrrE family metallo-endopeptidase n=1 Tax=Candidatus Synechococcus calcipolaris G9 TaxID=1497997 RepID=A0ABT6EYC3_9SYNE|nr:ImmA/IrrE family metallo-endopeptidase [Candidatus Synechococcus calcipolaris]MDG2989885.1 ImmA/IrrE family metallo-endopeptidase [Candidatus Synechococcus calcipolaris G9]